MPGGKRVKGQVSNVVLERRVRVAEMLLRDKTEREIAKVVGVSRGLVHRDVEAVRDGWRQKSFAAIEEINAELLAHEWRNYYRLLALFEDTTTDRVTVRTECEFELTHTIDGVTGRRETDRIPVKERAVRTVSPAAPDTSLMTAAAACLDRIARLTGAYKPTKIAATTPAGDMPAPLTGPTLNNFTFIDLSLDPKLLSDQELDLLCKIEQAQQLRISQEQAERRFVESPMVSPSMPSDPAAPPNG